MWFLASNRIPRRLATQLFGWFSRIEQPLVAALSLALWRRFADLRLDEAKKTRFTSVHDCFIRELKPDARPIDPDPEGLSSPCDGIIGEHGTIIAGQLLQAKGFAYRLDELLGDPALSRCYEGGRFVTIRITSSMYHRFHAPATGSVRRIDYLSGDTWNVDPIALQRIEALFCRNERAVVHFETARDGIRLLLVPIAAILVAGIRFHFFDTRLHPRYRSSDRIDRGSECEIDCGIDFGMQGNARHAKGEEMGWFEHGSTIVVIAPADVDVSDGVHTGARIRVGEPLMRISRRAG